jgi:hypothetical protein
MMDLDGSPMDQVDDASWASVHARSEARRLVQSMNSEPPIGPTHDQKNAQPYASTIMAIVAKTLDIKAKGTHFTSYMTQFTIDRCLQIQFSSSVFNLM